jgi:hypothetical protein
MEPLAFNPPGDALPSPCGACASPTKEIIMANHIDFDSVPFEPNWGALDKFIASIEYDEDHNATYQGQRVSDMMERALDSISV